MNRRQAIRTLALGAAAFPLASSAGARSLTRLAPSGPHAADPAPAGGAPAKPAPAAPTGPFVVPPLGYAYDALEPHIDAQTMQIHHDKHHAAYVTNLNKAVAGRKEVDGWTVEQLVRDLDKVPEDIRLSSTLGS